MVICVFVNNNISLMQMVLFWSLFFVSKYTYTKKKGAKPVHCKDNVTKYRQASEREEG